MSTAEHRALPSERVGDAAALNLALDRLEALPVVKTVACDPLFRNGRVIAWALWCGPTHEPRLKQPYVALNDKKLDDPSAVPTYQAAAEKLLEKIEREHGGCVEAAEAAAAAERTSKRAASTGASSSGGNALEQMMHVQQLRAAAAKLNAEALAATLKSERAAAELEAAVRGLDPKRQRPAGDDDAADASEACEACETCDIEQGPCACASGTCTNGWDLADHRREATRVHNRRRREMVAAPAREPHDVVGVED